jgi:hypothetical protein
MGVQPFIAQAQQNPLKARSGQEFWRRLEPAWRITGGMDKRFQPFETSGLWPGDEPVSWQISVTEERNRQASEIHAMLVPGPPAILLDLAIAKGATESRPHELLRCTGSLNDNCLFFESSEFRSSCSQAPPNRYPVKLSTFCISRDVGTATAKPNVCMRTAFNKMNQYRGSAIRAPIAHTLRNLLAL